MSESDEGSTSGAPTSPRRLLALVAAVGAIALAVVLTAVTRPEAGAEDAAAATQGSPTTFPVPTSRSTPSTSAPPPTPLASPTPEADAAAPADLARVAASLRTPLALSSPTTWDQWLPDGKPYPGASTEEEMSTCPRLADRLGTALGTKMSYWIGTLPRGPMGCTWATVPLTYGPDAPDYPYLASIGFVTDGSTPEQMSESFYHHEGRICPSVAVPAAGEGVRLVRCEELDGTSYALVLPDSRTSGVWVLYAMARGDAAHPATDVLRPVVEGAVSAFH